MNLPNYITLVRIVLIPFFINLMIYGYYREALVIFIVACITDALDGMIARLTNSKTELGAFLDPLADKLLIVSSFITLVLIGLLPVWFVIIVISRDVILVLGSLVLYFTGHDLKARPSIMGKATTAMQLLSVIVPMTLKAYAYELSWTQPLFGITAALTIGSGIQYVFRGTKIVG